MAGGVYILTLVPLPVGEGHQNSRSWTKRVGRRNRDEEGQGKSRGGEKHKEGERFLHQESGWVGRQSAAERLLRLTEWI